MLDLLTVLAEQGPLLVAIDDVQWLDPASTGALQIAFRRLRGERVGLLATLLRAPPLATPFVFDRALSEERLTRISLGPMSLVALHGVLKERIALELTRPELVRLQEATAGNPFYALELGRELVQSDTRPVAGRALRVPESLRELLGGRLARLPAETVDVLLQVAALARPTVELITKAPGEREGVRAALEAAIRAGVVQLDDSRIRFAHPLLASICWEQAPPWKRRAVHLELAETVGELEERARHLALAAEGPDAAVATELDSAAERAAARGAPAAAAELFELAAQLTPADPAMARQRRLRAANLHRITGDTDRAVTLLDELLTEVPSGVERADVLFARLSTFRGGTPALLELCDEALTEAAGDDVRSSQILALLSAIRLLAADVPAALVDARAALQKAERVGDARLIIGAIAHVGRAEAWAAEITPGLLERGAEIERASGLVLDYQESASFYLTRLLTRLGEIERSRAALEELEGKAAARGDEDTRCQALWYLSTIEWLAGRWQRALEHATTALELSEQVLHYGALQGRFKALVEADLGLVEQARASAEQGLAFAQAASNEVFVIISLGVLGRIELALGNLEAAAAYLRELPARLLAGGLNDPTLPVWADAIETMIALGELQLARGYLEKYELHGRRLGSPWTLAAAARCRGLLAAAEGDLATAFTAFERALVELEEHPYPFERARTLLSLGLVQRKAKQKRTARDTLERALAIFEELGARLWAEKARGELARVGLRHGSRWELTASEERVGKLAASGLTNREIAERLYLSPKTVESNLSRVYRKLDIHSRAELGARMAEGQGVPAQT